MTVLGVQPTEEQYDLVPWSHMALLTPAPQFDGTVGEAREIEKYLVAALEKHQGFGISACQLGINVNAFALAVNPPAAVFNARIVDVTDEKVDMLEACLSFPGLHISVVRPKACKVRFQTSDGMVQTEKYTGLTARAVMHELEHVQGRVFFDMCGRITLDVAARKAAKLGFEYPVGKLMMIAKQSQMNGEQQ